VELAAKKFNVEFLHYLVQGWSIKKAFDQAIISVKTQKNAVLKSCCCDHDHDPECLWLSYLE
jgi:hypothetical protein